MVSNPKGSSDAMAFNKVKNRLSIKIEEEVVTGRSSLKNGDSRNYRFIPTCFTTKALPTQPSHARSIKYQFRRIFSFAPPNIALATKPKATALPILDKSKSTAIQEKVAKLTSAVSARSTKPLVGTRNNIMKAYRTKEMSPRQERKMTKLGVLLGSFQQPFNGRSHSQDSKREEVVKEQDESYEKLVKEFKEAIVKRKGKIASKTVKETTVMVIPSRMVKPAKNYTLPQNQYSNEKVLKLPDDSNYNKMVTFIEDLKGELAPLVSSQPQLVKQETVKVVPSVQVNCGKTPLVEKYADLCATIKRQCRQPVQSKQLNKQQHKRERKITLTSSQSLREILKPKAQTYREIASENSDPLNDYPSIRKTLHIQAGEALNLFPKLFSKGFEESLSFAYHDIMFQNLFIPEKIV